MSVKDNHHCTIAVAAVTADSILEIQSLLSVLTVLNNPSQNVKFTSATGERDAASESSR